MDADTQHLFDEFDETNFAPSFNIAPQGFQRGREVDPRDWRCELTVMRRGLVSMVAFRVEITPVKRDGQ
jgi:hypothetical protein